MTAWRWLPVAAAAALTSLAAPAAADGARPPRATRAGALTVRSQPFLVTPGSGFSIVLGLPSAPPQAEVSVVVTIRAVQTIDALRPESAAALAGEPPADRIRVPAPVSATPPPTVSFTVPTTGTAGASDDPATLTLAPGTVYAAEIGVEGATTSFDPVTTLIATPLATPPARRLPVGVLLGAAGEVSVDDAGEAHFAVAGASASRERLDALIRALHTSPAKTAVHLPAGFLAAVANDAPELVGQLANALEGRTLISEPLLPLNAGSAAASGLAATYLSWLREGEDLASRTVNHPARRSVGVIEGSLTEAGAALRHDVGNQLLVLPHAQATASGWNVTWNGLSASGEVTLSNGVHLDLVTPDPFLGRLLGGGGTPSAARIASALTLAARTPPPPGSAAKPPLVLLASGDLGVADPEVLRALTEMLGGGQEVEIVDLDGQAGMADALPGASFRWAAAPLVSLDGRARLIADTLVLSDDTASMLPAGDARRARWQQQVAALASTAVDQAEVVRRLDALGAQRAAVHSAVLLPEPYRVTLGGRKANVRLRLTNTSATRLQILVAVSSPGERVLLPSPSLVTLGPAEASEIALPVEARSGGRSQLLVELRTPNGEQTIAGPVAITLSVRDLRSTGYVLSGGALLVLGAWWWRHVRRRRGVAALPSLDDEPD